ncbi:leucyl/phenylalanyl-tRNA--protein transferase [Desulfuromonas versatilis]|uniref:Leucyl/phenylalanyl-tRNA--protein transferase n=1 Tax=Desulfuromonas versatilis TaxID=2802975 RepID=A0ABN6DVV3_9BACT|nr:leucyl/phenylalanyl-tRNA--protein transferase [Desulfuromonas versatilis]BCR03907.1 leucyl/phenylalanyl-tRNA--protein transferase [Desulfuromonas versatilis]
MPVFQLIDQPVFPPPRLADPEGLLAVGGDLSPARLLLAYSMGIFPWFNEGDPLLWWSPDPRCVLDLADLKISRSLAKVLRQGVFELSFDRAFAQVIDACAELRRQGGAGTWITPEMKLAYGELHQKGYAHSVECWHQGQLAGGLYGVCLGRCFFGESMFHRVSNASKVALVGLVSHLAQRRFALLDCQMPTSHLISLGARCISRDEFLQRLRQGGVEPSVSPVPGGFD